MVFQSYALYPHMTVRDNMAFGLKLRKLPKADIEKRVKEAAGILSLEKLLDRKPKELSGGQRQRVALGRAIVREPAVFLMDEPLSNLDAKLRVQTRAEIARLHQRMGTTFVYVTHDQVEAMTMGTRIAVMSDGLLQQVGTPQVLYDTPANRFVAGLHRQPVDELRRRHLRLVRRHAEAHRPGRLVGDPAAPLRGVGRRDHRPQARRRASGPSTSSSMPVEGDTVTLPGHADVVEYLGNEELLHVTAAEKDIVAIVGSDHRVKPGDVLKLILPLSKLHLFDAESGAQPDLGARRGRGLTGIRRPGAGTARRSRRRHPRAGTASAPPARPTTISSSGSSTRASSIGAAT